MNSKQVLLQASAMVLGLLVQGAAFAASDYLDQGGRTHKIEVRGTQAILIGMNKPAPDGVYRGKDGKTITVKNGNVVQGVVAPIDHKASPAHKGIKGEIAHKGPEAAIKGELKAIK
jgi:hypothetical protein